MDRQADVRREVRRWVGGLLLLVGFACAVRSPETNPSAPLKDEIVIERTEVAFRGSNGRNGMDGSKGSSGSTGSSALRSSKSFRAGGRGGNGGRGGDGGRGHDGANGPDLNVEVGLRAGARPQLEVQIEGAGRVERFIVDPGSGVLTIRTEGGKGGRGGRGGSGGQGGRGGSGRPSGSSGLRGSSGSDGFSGRHGSGGSIRMAVDPAARRYLHCLRLENQGALQEVSERSIPAWKGFD